MSGFPVSLAWLSQLRPAIREVFAKHVLQMFIEQGQQTEETGAVLQHYANAAPGEAGENIVELLPRFDILSANFDRARRHIAALPESEAHLAAAYEASIAFLTGDNAAAIAGFRAALKLLRKSLGKRKVAFEAEAGLFHMLALLRANDPALHTELRGLIDAATMEVTPYYLAHRGVEALLDLIEGRHEKAQQAAAQLVEQPSRCPAAGTIVALAALFIDSALMRERVVDNEAEYNRLAKTMPVLARIYAGILSRTARDGTSWRERAAGLGGKDLIEITEIIAFKQPWERAFDTLTAFLKPGEPKRPAEKTTCKDQAPCLAGRLSFQRGLRCRAIDERERLDRGTPCCAEAVAHARCAARLFERARPAHVPLRAQGIRTGITTATTISTNTRRCRHLPDIPTSTMPPAASTSN